MQRRTPLCEHRGVLASSLKDISIPAGDHLDHDLKWSISHYIRQITAYVSKLRRHRSFRRLMAKERIYSSAIPRSRREKFLMGLLLEEHIPVTPATLSKLGHMYNMKETEVTCGVPLAIYIIDLYRRFDVHKMLGASTYGEQPSNAFTWQHALISLREISIYVSLLLVFYCKC